jgi:hypothetical protein
MQKENGKDTEIQAHHGASIDYHKKELECQKLRAEIAQISLAWWKKPAYVSIVIPIVIALIALLTAWSKGYFSSERATLKKEILDMTIQITEEKAHLQEIIDDAYMIISIAEFTARFALKDHVRPMLDNINRNLKQLQQKKQ